MNQAAFERLDELYTELSGLDPTSRSGRLAQLRGEESELAQSLERMLAVSTVDVEEELRRLAAVGELTPDEAEMLGSYRLLGKIGEGGFGVVYLAEQRRPVQRVVAVKVIKPGMDTRAVLARFRDEQQAMAVMDHPGVVTAIDAGTTAQGRPFIVMPLVPGQTITAFCRETKADARVCCRLMEAVARAVEHAHGRGVIHRDIKPGNILVTIVYGQPLPRLIDFGLAKALTQPLTPHSTLTVGGELLGTLEYMSPEQAEGRPLDVRTDVYAMGAVLFEILTGRAPIPAESLRQEGTAADTLRHAIAEAPIPAPSSIVSGLPREVDWIVLHCLEKEPGRRYPTAAAFADDLQRFVAGEVVHAGPSAKLYRLSRWAWKRRVVLGAGTLVLFALIAGAAVAISFGLREQSARRDAEQVTDFWRTFLSGLDPSVAQGRDPTLMLLALKQARTQLKQASLTPQAEQPIAAMIAEAYEVLGEYVTAEPFAVQAKALAETLWGLDDARTIAAERCRVVVIGYTHANLESDAERFLGSREQLWERANRVLPYGSRERLRTLSEVFLHGGLRNHEDTQRRLRDLQEESERVLGRADPMTLRIMRIRAKDIISEHQEGLAILLDARSRAVEALGPDSAEAEMGLGTESFHMSFIKGNAETAEYLKEHLPAAERLLGSTSQTVLVSMYNLSNFMLMDRRYAEAEVYARSCLERARRKAGKNGGWVDWSLGCLLPALLRNGRQAEADLIDAEIQSRWKSQFPGEDPPPVTFDGEMGPEIVMAFAETDQRSRAEPYLRAIRRSYPKQFEEIHTRLQSLPAR